MSGVARPTRRGPRPTHRLAILYTPGLTPRPAARAVRAATVYAAGVAAGERAGAGRDLIELLSRRAGAEPGSRPTPGGRQPSLRPV